MNAQKKQRIGRETRLNPGDIIPAALINRLITLLHNITSESPELTVNYANDQIIFTYNAANSPRGDHANISALIEGSCYTPAFRITESSESTPAKLQMRKFKLAVSNNKIAIIDCPTDPQTPDVEWVDIISLTVCEDQA